ncbi:MAG: hypothetical protein ABR564_09445 [Candidatus Dormibacteria bacterium]
MAVAVAVVGPPLASPAHRMAVWRAYLRCCEVAMAVEAVAGVLLAVTGRPPRNPLHWLYGGAALASLPLANRMSAFWPPGRERVVLGLGALAAALLALRAVLTGG